MSRMQLPNEPPSRHRLQHIARRNQSLPWLNGQEKSVLRNISDCLTERMGGNESVCECGHHEMHYNSCRNRHCPLCQGAARARWVRERMKELLPVPYFHVVFTIPHELLPIVYANRRECYRLLFQCAHDTLLAVCANQANLGAHVGGLSVLHTWNQKLAFHPHVHVIIPSGGISSDGQTWIAGRSSYLVSVKRLSNVFRGKFLHALESALDKGKLLASGNGESAIPNSGDERSPRSLLQKAACKDFVVYAKQPFGGPAQVLKYLGRYTHRVGISEQRIVSDKNNTVTFSYTDRAAGYAKKVMTISDEAFIKKFMLHILPKGLRKIRYFGYMSNRDRGASLHHAHELITASGIALPVSAAVGGSGKSEVLAAEKDESDSAELSAEKKYPVCSKCGRTMTVRPLDREAVGRSSRNPASSSIFSVRLALIRKALAARGMSLPPPDISDYQLADNKSHGRTIAEQICAASLC
jgi:hypothetical protein